MSLFFYIVVFAALGALVLGLVLKMRLREREVWEELVNPDVSSNPAEVEAFRGEQPAGEMKESQPPENSQGEEMTTSPFSQPHDSGREIELRRSSRLERPVSLVILGTNRRGEIFQERTAAVSVNLHGCRYTSRHDYAPDGWVTLQVTGTDGASSRPVRARVRSVFSAQSSRELCQVGVELETPGNVWGIAQPPDDWQRMMAGSVVGSRNGSSAGAAQEVAAMDAYSEKAANPTERRAEVTVFPGPSAATTPVAEVAAEKEGTTTKPERVVVSAEQLLQALQGKLQAAADKAVQASLSAQIDEAVKAALSRIEDGWKANVRQSDEFSAARMAEAQALWEGELHSYRDRAEEVARRIEALTSMAQQALGDSQRFVERFAAETAPQLHARLNDACSRSSADLEARVSELSAQHAAKLNETAQQAANEARARLEESIAKANAPATNAVSKEHLESRLEAVRSEASERLEKRLDDLYTGVERQIEQLRNRTSDLAHQLEGVALEFRQARAQHEQNLTEVRAQVSNADRGVAPEQVQTLLQSSREQVLSHLEWRLGEVSGHFEQLIGQTHGRANELSQQMEMLAAATREHLNEAQALAEKAPRGLAPQDLATVEQAVQHASREFENVAARVSDRQLIRMMEQKQVVTREASLELEARTSEARALLQKESNGIVEEFRRRLENQIDVLLAETQERAASSLASLDAESRAAVEARRRTLESDVARAAEQSTNEFRSGMKAFLYSCLVAAVSAVDQHAQTTLAGVTNDPKDVLRQLEGGAEKARTTDILEFPPKAAGGTE